jgi:hypothetical protein
MTPAGFEPTIPASKRPGTHALDHAATGIGHGLTLIAKSVQIHNTSLTINNWMSLLSHRACCHTRYTLQHMHYSHYKTHSRHHQTSRSPKARTPNTHRWHTHAAIYCVIIQTQRTQISGRNSNGTKHSGGLPEDGREKKPKHVGVLYLRTRF